MFKISAKKNFVFDVEDYILYVLNKIEPDKSDKLKLNKVLFFVEFAYIFFKDYPLSKADYAAIPNGPAVDQYGQVFRSMEEAGKIKIEGYTVRPLKDPASSPPEEIASFIDPLIKKYASLTNSELIDLSHSTDSFMITSDNGRQYGKIIDKDLAYLETFFQDSETERVNEEKLPKIDISEVIRYGSR